ncbi:MAG TPA: hypothetical protein VL992_12895 [Tepidisphaeraceae bacterium]|nr:hypothetical protein [Tepidisphaeraceae bacterium]
MASKVESPVDSIIHLKRKEPFEPFQIVMTSGDRYTIDDPERLVVAAIQLHYYPHSGMGIHLRLNQIAAVAERSDRPAA